MLEVSNLVKKYSLGKNNEQVVLNGVNTSFKKGDFAVILGPSGCGKSTLLNIIGGLDGDYKGTILYKGKNLREYNLDLYRKNEIGFVFQNFNLIPHLNILENIKIAMYLDGKDEKVHIKRAEELLNLVGLKDHIYKLPSELSGGQKQRVAIARALSNNSKIIVADEPTGALDSKTSKEVIDLLKELTTKGITVIMVTHDKDLTKYATKVICLKDGLIEEEYRVSQEENNIENNHKYSDKPRLGIMATFKIALNNFKNRKIRNILISLGTSIGIMGIILGLAFGTGVQDRVKGLFDSVLSPESFVVTMKNKGDAKGINYTKPFSKEQQEEVRSVLKEKGATEGYEQVFLCASGIYYDGKEVDISKIGGFSELDLSSERMKNYSYDKGFLISGKGLDRNKEGVLIPQNVAKNMLDHKRDDLSKSEYDKLIDKDITIKNSEVIEGKQISYEYKVKIKGIVKVPSGLSDMKLIPVYMSRTTTDNILKKFNQKREVLGFMFYAKDAKNCDEIVQSLNNNKKYSFQNTSSLSKEIGQTINLIKAILTFIAALSLVVASIMICIVLFISVIERTREIGVMRAIGYKKSYIRKIFLYESVIIILLANLFAIIISFLISGGLNVALKRSTGFEEVIKINLKTLLLAAIVTLFTGFISALYPAYRASKLDPVKSLHYE